MEIKQLKTFLAIAACGSVTKASIALHVVQPALSRQIMLLEKELGTTLFERVGHGMQLTNAGQILLVRAKNILREVDDAKQEIQFSPEAIQGLVVVGLLPSVSDLLASVLIQSVRNKYPKITIRVLVGYVGYLQEWLEKNELDMALLYSQAPSPLLELTPLLHEELFLVGPPNSELAMHQPMQFKDLKNLSFIMPANPHGSRVLLEQACAVSGTTLKVVAETNSMQTQKNLVEAGIGFTILPGISIDDDIQKLRLKAAPIIDPVIRRQINLAVPVARKASLAVRVVMQELHTLIEELVQNKKWSSAVLIDSE